MTNELLAVWEATARLGNLPRELALEVIGEVRSLRAQLLTLARLRAEDAGSNLDDLQVLRDNRDSWKQRAEQAEAKLKDSQEARFQEANDLKATIVALEQSESSLAAMTEERDRLREALKAIQACGDDYLHIARAALEGSKL